MWSPRYIYLRQHSSVVMYFAQLLLDFAEEISPHGLANIYSLDSDTLPSSMMIFWKDRALRTGARFTQGPHKPLSVRVGLHMHLKKKKKKGEARSPPPLSPGRGCEAGPCTKYLNLFSFWNFFLEEEVDS